jgi:hypothetical protein
MNWLNTEGSNFKPYLIRFSIHDVWICSWKQFECYHYNKLEETTKYVPIGYSHRNAKFCFDRIILLGYYSNVELVVSRM